MARHYFDESIDWIRANEAELNHHADPIVREAFAVVSWDSVFIESKLYRALGGLDRMKSGEDSESDHGVQNDWNGSAKVALLSIDRSADAWALLAVALNSSSAMALAGLLTNLRQSVLDMFPQARLFRRPGFDQERQ